MPATHHQNAAWRSTEPSAPTAAASCPVDSVTWRTSIGRPKKRRHAGTRPSIMPERDVGREARDVGAPPGAQRAAHAPPQLRDEARVPGDRAVEPVPDEPVLGPAGDQRAGKQQHAGEGGEERRRAEQRERLQHVLGRPSRRPAARRTRRRQASCTAAPAEDDQPGCRRCPRPASGSGSPPRRRSPRRARRSRRRSLVGELAAIAGAVIAGCLVATVQCSSCTMTKLAA